MRKVVLGYEWDETFDAVPYEEPNRDVEAGASGNASSIELTTTPPTAGLKDPPPSSLAQIPNTMAEGAEEDSFTGTPVSESKPKLTQRAHSKDRLKKSEGTFT